MGGGPTRIQFEEWCLERVLLLGTNLWDGIDRILWRGAVGILGHNLLPAMPSTHFSALELLYKDVY